LFDAGLEGREVRVDKILLADHSVEINACGVVAVDRRAIHGIRDVCGQGGGAKTHGRT
jgi:hypothetical protein